MSREVVTVDISNFSERKHEIAQQLLHAASDVGFFYVVGHGISQQEIDDAFTTGKQFLSLSKDVKKRWPFNPERYLGWRGPDELETVTGNRLWEWFSVGHYGLGGYDMKESKFVGHEWPPEAELGLADFRSKALHFQQRTHAVALTVLSALAIGLGYPEDFFDEPFALDAEDNPSFMAWNKYPAVSPEDAAKPQQPPRLHAHADMDVLTILYQRVGDVGLEIAPGNEVDNPDIIEDVGNIWNQVPVARQWTALDPKAGAVVVNIGDGLTRWTDGLLKSTYHRVRAPTSGDPLEERYSIPYFVNPKLNFAIQGPTKRWPPLTGYDLLAKTGAAYEARKNDPTKAWQTAAYGTTQAA